MVTGFFDAQRFADGVAGARAAVVARWCRPTSRRWQDWLRPLLDTLAMSIAGTALAVVFSLPLALLAAPQHDRRTRVVYQARAHRC